MAENAKPQERGLGGFWTALIVIAVPILTVFAYDRLIVAKKISSLKGELAGAERSMEKIGAGGGREVVAVDLNAYLQKQEELLKKGVISEARFKTNLAEFILKVKRMPKDMIVLSTDAVLTNVPVVEP